MNNMPVVKVKICGITNYADADEAVRLGADFLGFNFYEKSPRFITPDNAVNIIKNLPGFVDIIGVFVNASIEYINEVINICHLNWIQLHGDENPDFCRELHSLNLRIIKAIRVKNKNDIVSAEEYLADAILLDAFDPDQYGGTGKNFDWTIIDNLKNHIFLAGGINQDNAAEAAKTGVYAIDICSGIEETPGKKDHKKMKKLFENISFLRG